MRIFKRILFLLIMSFTTSFAHAVTLDAEAATLDVKQANMQFDKINLQLSTHDLSAGMLNNAVTILSTLVLQANQCVEIKQAQLANIERLAQQNIDLTNANNDSVASSYLNTEKAKIDGELAQCRLFSIRAAEAIDAYKTALVHLKQDETLARGKSLWQLMTNFRVSTMQESLVHIGASTSILFKLKQLFFSYMLTVIGVLFIFKIKKIKSFLHRHDLALAFFKRFTIFLSTFYGFFFLDQVLSNYLDKDDYAWQFGQILLLFFVLLGGIYFVYYFCRAHKQVAFIKRYYKAIEKLSGALFVFFALLNVIGYQELVMRLTFSLLTTCAMIFITIIVLHIINQFYMLLTQQETYKKKITNFLGYQEDKIITEFVILKITVQIIIILLSLYITSRSWGFAAYYFEDFYAQILTGVHIANMTIYPTRIIWGVITFCVLYLLFRAIATRLSRRRQFDDEEEAQVAIVSILTYAGFGLAFIAGCLVAGFDFTGLAIVAGALSVGIGLGLQSIVNNFVSGLILLIEKPIKPGDRISVDGVEGQVKKISVRSTQIVTGANEDIIIPNSDLITRQVVNFMYSDKFIRICCDMRVAFDSNTQLLRDLLLNIANSNDDVIKTGRNKPVVLFHAFGDIGFEFQLWCLIKDANKKGAIHSELNFEIERVFREHHIKFATIQTDFNLALDK